MDNFSKRVASLSPKQRELLERKLKEKGVASAGVLTSPTQPASEFGQTDQKRTNVAVSTAPVKMDFGIFFFSSNGATDDTQKYDALIKLVQRADEYNFSSAWIPERHFQDFGGLYPNPSVVAAAMAVLTNRIQIRAGSVVAPLHHPIRIAEEWSVVDNLSQGRIGLSFGTGWNPKDFVIRPENYESRREIMFKDIESIARLWRGESVEFVGGEGTAVPIQLAPRPIQTNLPIWITSSGSAHTWEKAGELGVNVLAAMIMQNFDDLEERIKRYREARQRAGHDPEGGIVTIMLHTFLGEDEKIVKEQVRLPMYEYLQKFIKQQQDELRKTDQSETNKLKQAIVESEEDVLAFAFERYFKTSSLLGTPEKCERTVEKLGQIGVNEIACLVDFGLDVETILQGMELLRTLHARFA